MLCMHAKVSRDAPDISRSISCMTSRTFRKRGEFSWTRYRLADGTRRENLVDLGIAHVSGIISCLYGRWVGQYLVEKSRCWLLYHMRRKEWFFRMQSPIHCTDCTVHCTIHWYNPAWYGCINMGWYTSHKWYLQCCWCGMDLWIII